jgi:hypothetical protein
MGWMFSYRPKGLSHREFFRDRWGAEFDDGVLDMAAANNVIYTAYRTQANGHEGQVVALVFLTRWAPSDPQFNFGFKEMDETMGPFEARCPERILDLLTPTTNEQALKWRAACREYHAQRRAQAGQRLKLRPGLVVRTAAPVVFSNGAEAELFCIADARRLRAYTVAQDVNGDGRYFMHLAVQLNRRVLQGATEATEVSLDARPGGVR